MKKNEQFPHLKLFPVRNSSSRSRISPHSSGIGPVNSLVSKSAKANGDEDLKEDFTLVNGHGM